MRKFYFMTEGRERDLIRYSIGSNIKEAHAYTLYKTKADAFLKTVAENPFIDWGQY